MWVCLNADELPTYHYCIVRNDLPVGVTAAQLVHAAGESGPVTSGTYAVVLACADEAELAELERTLLQFNIQHVAIREPDMSDALTAIGLSPVKNRKGLPNAIKKLKLYTGGHR